MVFPKNNLPTQSQPWTRDVEKRVENLESSFRSAEVNNVTRDSQALSQIRRLDGAVTDVAQAAADAAAAAAAAATAASNAQAAIDGLGDLDQATSTYKINAANVTVGTLSGDRISGGQIVGTTLKTDDTGPRLELNLNNILFYDDDGNFSGKIDAEENGRASTLYVGTGVTGVFMYNGGLDLEANGAVRVTGGNGLSVTGGNLTADNRITSVGTFNATAAFAANVFIASNGNFARATGTSSREAKQDITPLEFNKEAFLEISPVTFKYKDGIITEGENPQTVGFIAEDFVDAGLSDFLVTPPNEYDSYIGLRYDKMYMFLHSVVQSQAETIKALEARIATLEGQV